MSDEDTVKLTVSLGVTYAVNSYRTEEIDTGTSPEEWAEMSEEQREALGEELYQEWRSNYLDGSWIVAEKAAH